MNQETMTISFVEVVTVEMAIDTFINIDMVGLSKKTCGWYEYRLKILLRWLGRNRNIISILEVDLLNYYKHLDNSKIAPYTKHGYIRAVKKFFKFLHRRDILTVDLAKDLKLPKLPVRARKGLSDKSVLLLLDASKHNKRDYALLHFLESTNCRLGGIQSLRLSNLSMDAPEPFCRRVIVHEKGDADRVVIMSKDCFIAMRNYLLSRHSMSDFVFLTKTGTPLTSFGIGEILDRYKKRLGIKESISPHQWRHRWCRKQIQNKMPLTQVSQLAGHKSITVTANFYGTFAIDELQEAFDRYYISPENKQ